MRKKKHEPLPLLQTGVGTVLSSMAISGFILGFATDQIADTTPLFMLIFGALGVVGGTMKAHKFLMMVPGQKKSDKEQKQRRDKHTTTDD
ncbi:MAG: AtpZ/AtpI family protein [Gammaproteobacteria bacterium]|nr:AtpZ/AtpI family protein [Gammaproteobacteria bacterium]